MTISKRMKTMLIILAILFGCIFIYKIFTVFMIKRYISAHSSPTITVSTIKASHANWQPQIKASGTLRAVRGVNVTTELAGLVRTIYFTPGANVVAGEVLVQLNANTELAQLQAAEANAALAKITYQRDKAQYAIQGVSKQQLDTDRENLKNLEAVVAQQTATLNKKTIRAPFSGRLGISAINPGQYLNPGDPVTTLQTLNPIYIDFFVPQQSLGLLQVGQPVSVTTDTFPGKIFTGKITTINPVIDKTTRNVEVEATLLNPEMKLYPGMFANVTVNAGAPKSYLTLPQTAVSYNPYGDIVFLVQSQKSADKTILIAHQVFVTTGETRGDRVAILKGIKANDVVVTSGQLKLKNGTQVAVNNRIVPSNAAEVNVSDE